MTAPQLSVDTVGDPASNTTVPQVATNVNDSIFEKLNQQKFVDNMQKIGYTENEIDSLFWGLENDESRSNETAERRYEKSIYNGLRAIFSDCDNGTLQTERTFKGTTRGNRRGISSVLQISNDEAGLNNNSAFSYGEQNSKFSVDD